MYELDRRYIFTMPAGTISSAGISLLLAHMQTQSLQSDRWKTANPATSLYYLPPLPDTWQWVWAVLHGEYRGTFPKRVSQYYHKSHRLQCPPAFLAEIGNIARAHSHAAITVNFEIVDRIDWDAGDFGEEPESCWWNEFEYARTMFIDNGGLAIRLYDADDNGYGRAWLVPIGNRYIIFNGYGFAGNSTLTIAQLFAAFMNLSYRKIDLTNNGTSSSTLWINAGIGYMVGNDLTASHYDFGWYDDSTRCEDCGTLLYEDESYYGPDDYTYCERCFYRSFDHCTSCGEAYHRDEITEKDGEYLCPNCLTE
jgi:hypothetical protein